MGCLDRYYRLAALLRLALGDGQKIAAQPIVQLLQMFGRTDGDKHHLGCVEEPQKKRRFALVGIGPVKKDPADHVKAKLADQRGSASTIANDLANFAKLRIHLNFGPRAAAGIPDEQTGDPTQNGAQAKFQRHDIAGDARTQQKPQSDRGHHERHAGNPARGLADLGPSPVGQRRGDDISSIGINNLDRWRNNSALGEMKGCSARLICRSD